MPTGRPEPGSSDATVVERPQRESVSQPVSDEVVDPTHAEPYDLPTRASGSGTSKPGPLGLGASVGGSSPSLSSSSKTSVGSPMEALHRAEILGTKSFCKITAAIGLAGAAAMLALPG